MNTHSLLSDYWDEPNYPEIAQYAQKLASTPDITEADLLSSVHSHFGAPQPRMKMSEQHAPYNIWGKDLIEPAAIEQMETALRIPPALNGALMPDAHLGYALPIGGVIALDNAISPSYIGYDISCMMMLSVFQLSPEEFVTHRDNFAKLLRENTHFGIGQGWKRYDHPVLDDKRWSISQAVANQRNKAVEQIGTSGGGNHFADLVLVEGNTPYIGLLTHSGSRGAGHKIATAYTKLASEETKRVANSIPKEHGWLRFDTDAGQEYFEAMLLMGEYAYANHELIHTTFAKIAYLQVRQNIWNRHNFAWQTDNGILHRKGATPAHMNELGLIPGTSGTPSYIVRGKGNPNSLNSSSHGAGRPFSRTVAKKRHNQVEFKQRMENILHFGVAEDETFLAYKNIHAVLAEQTDLIDIVAEMKPLVVIMGGRSDDGD
jgi:tRNA-splicing ligase RtcB